MKQILRNVGNLLLNVIYYGSIIFTVLFFAVYITNIKNDVVKVQQGQTQIYSAIAESFTQVIYIQSKVISLIETLDNVSTAREKASKTRDQAIVNLVKNSQVDLQKSLQLINQKPSDEYLNQITVFIVMKEKVDSENGWLGTGVVIKETEDSTYIVTNSHVCKDGYICYVQEGENTYPITTVKRSTDDNDVQIIKVSGHIEGKIPVKGIADTQRGNRVYVMGHNLGRPFLYAEGVVAGFYEAQINELIISVATAPGNSGSGVIDANGYLVGLVYAVSAVPQDKFSYTLDLTHAVCVNSKVLRLFLNGYLQ